MKAIIYSTMAALIVTVASADDLSWRSPQECYEAHIRFAKGAYPQPEDHPSDLLEYCEKAYAAKKCNFACEVTRVQWEWVLVAPQHKRFGRLNAYFRMHRCTGFQGFPLNMLPIVGAECTDECNR